MIIVVNDACFLIDLIDVGLLDEFFQLGFQPHITPSVLAELMSINDRMPKAECEKRLKQWT